MNQTLQQRRPSIDRHRDRGGAIVVLAALMMIVFLASVAFSVDVAYMQLTKVKLRSATDAAARAAGEGLSREQDTDYARQAAKDIAAENLVAGQPLLLDDSDVVFGKSTQTSNGAWAFAPGGEPINAVRVFGRRTRTAPSGSVPIFFGRVFNVFDFQPTQAATVVRLDRDICVVVDRSSSMKLYLSDPDPVMSTGDWRFCLPPNMAQSRWGALSVALDRFLDALETTPQTEHVRSFPTPVTTPPAATRTMRPTSIVRSAKIPRWSPTRWPASPPKSGTAPRISARASSRAFKC